MFAFQSGGSGGETPCNQPQVVEFLKLPAPTDEQSMPESPLAAAALSTAAASSSAQSSVKVCLFDPEAYPGDQLRELCIQDHTARNEVEQLYESDTRQPANEESITK